MNSLIQCPFCNSANVAILGATACYGQCRDCGASTGLYDHPEDAEKAWNTRNGIPVQNSAQANINESEVTL